MINYFHHCTVGCACQWPPSFEQDEETGEWTAYNDDLRVVAAGSTTQEAMTRYYECAVLLLQQYPR